MNTPKWGRKETIIFPPHSPIYTYGAVFFALILTGMFVYLRFSRGQTPLQQFYTPIYLRTAVGGVFNGSHKYQLLYAAGVSTGVELAFESDVKDGTTTRLRRAAYSAGTFCGGRGAGIGCSLSRPSSRNTLMAVSIPTSKTPFMEATGSGTSTKFRSSSASSRCLRSSHSPSARTFAAARN